MSPIHVEILRDGAVQHRAAVPPAGLTIGRSPEVELVLSDPGVSRSHCVIW